MVRTLYSALNGIGSGFQRLINGIRGQRDTCYRIDLSGSDMLPDQRIKAVFNEISAKGRMFCVFNDFEGYDMVVFIKIDSNLHSLVALDFIGGVFIPNFKF